MEKVVTTAKLVLEHPDLGIYVVQRAQSDVRGGKLDLPGGELEDSEDPLTGVMREFAEEVGPVPDDIAVTKMVPDVRLSSHGHVNLRFLIYALTERLVHFDPNQQTAECSKGYFLPRRYAAIALGHCVQRQAVIGTLPDLRQSAQPIIPEKRQYLQPTEYAFTM